MLGCVYMIRLGRHIQQHLQSEIPSGNAVLQPDQVYYHGKTRNQMAV